MTFQVQRYYLGRLCYAGVFVCFVLLFLFWGGDVLRLDALFWELRHITWGVMGVSDLKMLCG